MDKTEMKVAVLFSGGKDSCYTVWLLQHQGWEVAALLTVSPSSQESMLFHYPGINWTSMQAQALGIPHFTVEPEGDELEALEDALTQLRKEQGIVGMAAGAVASDYQRSRFDRVCDSVAIKSYCPLWHKDPKAIQNDLLNTGFRAIMTGVAALGLDESWLGREMNEAAWVELRELSRHYGINLAGEGGEYETLVLDAPFFRKRIEISKSEKVWKRDRGTLFVTEARLVPKSPGPTANLF